jgi:aryl-alcohol dehydrogenase-like predicted oxidoreductase
MNYRTLGKTGLQVSELGFGCGAVGGLLVRGEYTEMVAAVERAIAAGITYFDTARMYGNGESEKNLGRVLAELKANVLVGSKVQLAADEMDEIESAIISAVEDSLRRLRCDVIDLMQLHNPIGIQRRPERGWVAVADVEQALAAFARLQQEGKIRFYGINGLGDTDAVHQAVALGRAQTIQCCYNLLNPTAGMPTPPGFPFQDYRQLIDRAAEQQMGVIAIRVLAAGALSGTVSRHPNAAQSVAPIASGADLAEDATQAHAFQHLVDEGAAGNLVELAIRFAISKPAVSTTLVGISSLEQLEAAIHAVERGPLPAPIFGDLRQIWAGFGGG